MTTLNINKDSVRVIINPGQYRFFYLGAGPVFCFLLDEEAKQFLSQLITNKNLIRSDGTCYAIYVNEDIQNVDVDVNKTNPYILTLDLGHDCANREAIVALHVKEMKEDV